MIDGHSELERIGYELAFSSIIYSIENKVGDFSDTVMLRIREANNLFGNVIRGLGVFLGSCEMEDYEPSKVKSLRKILKAVGYDFPKPSKENAEMMKKEFEGRIIQLDQLRENPNEFYDGENSQELLSLCKKMKNLYAVSNRTLD